MVDFRPITDDLRVAGQISLDDPDRAASLGVTQIINNRPDGEDPGQLSSAAMEAAVRAAGLEYHHIPIVGQPTPDQVAAVDTALRAGGSTLMYCRSGTRSVMAWASATSAGGRMSADDIRAAAAAAGYDLSRLPL